VTVFFFLSGYLITTLMRAEYEKNATVSLRHFWLRRALRILPPLYLVVLGSVLLALAVYPPGTVRGPAVATPASTRFCSGAHSPFGTIRFSTNRCWHRIS